MSDESRTEFQLWAETEFINGPLQYHGMYLGWHARDAEVNDLKRSLTIADVSLHTQVIANEALKARVEGVPVFKVSEENQTLRARVEELEDRLFAHGEMNTAPCFACGYNGSNYFHPKYHPCAARHHKLHLPRLPGEQR